MSFESDMDQIDVKRIKLENKHDKLAGSDGTCRNSAVDCFKNKCMKLFTEQLDYKMAQAYNNFNNTGKIIKIMF